MLPGALRQRRQTFNGMAMDNTKTYTLLMRKTVLAATIGALSGTVNAAEPPTEAEETIVVQAAERSDLNPVEIRYCPLFSTVRLLMAAGWGCLVSKMPWMYHLTL